MYVADTDSAAAACHRTLQVSGWKWSCRCASIHMALAMREIELSMAWSRFYAKAKRHRVICISRKMELELQQAGQVQGERRPQQQVATEMVHTNIHIYIYISICSYVLPPWLINSNQWVQQVLSWAELNLWLRETQSAPNSIKALRGAEIKPTHSEWLAATLPS